MGKWEMVRLGDIVDIINGFAFKSDKYSNSGIRVIRITNVQKGFVEDLQPQFYPVDEASKKYHLLENDLLISLTGNVGRVAIISKEYLPAALNQRVACLRIKNPSYVDKIYIFSILNSEVFENDCVSSSRGVAQKNLSTEWLKQYLIPLPPIDEQKRIAKNLDLASEIVKGYKEQIAKLDKLVQSVFYEMFGDPLLNPFVFPISTLGNLADVISGITKGRKLGNSQHLFEVPYMAVSNVKAGYIDWTTVKTITATQEEIDRYRIFENDILMTEGGDPDKLGRGSIISKVPQNCIHQNHIFRVRCKAEGVIPQYFSEYLKHASAKQYFLRCAKQTTGIASINMTQLRSLPVMVPPLPIQTRFASIVTEIESQKAQVQHALTEAENLFNSLMQEYF